MQTPDSQTIVKRFFEALYYLKDEKVIRGKATFARRYGIDRWNLNKLEGNPASDIFQPAWLYYLVRDYGVSSQWLLTGRGKIMPAKEVAAPNAKKLAERQKLELAAKAVQAK